MSPKIPINQIIIQLRQEMPKIDVLYMTRLVATFLNALAEANEEATRRLLFTEFPIKPELAAEIGLGDRVRKTGSCVATCFDLLSYVCGFVRFADDRISGSLSVVYEPTEAGEEEIRKLKGFIAVSDIPLQAIATGAIH